MRASTASLAALELSALHSARVLTQGAKAIVDAGRALAQRLGHDELAPEHVVLAATDTPIDEKILVWLIHRSVDVRRLRSALRARLDARPVVKGYRDGPV